MKDPFESQREDATQKPETMPSWDVFDFILSATKRPPAKPFKRATVATTPPERDFITLAQPKDMALQG